MSRDLTIVEVLVGQPVHFAGFGLVHPPSPTLQRFRDTELQASVDKILAGLPADRWAVELNVSGDADGVDIIGAIKSDNGWSLIGAASRVSGGKWSGSVSVRKEWK